MIASGASPLESCTLGNSSVSTSDDMVAALAAQNNMQIERKADVSMFCSRLLLLGRISVCYNVVLLGGWSLVQVKYVRSECEASVEVICTQVNPL